MAWSGGTYTKGNNGTGGWVGDAALGITIEPTRHDTQDNDFAAGINNCLAKDGQNSMTNNLNFGGYRPSNVAAGTAAAPAICAGNDVNTGMYSPAADQIGFATNGVERATITSDGRTAIGVGGDASIEGVSGASNTTLTLKGTNTYAQQVMITREASQIGAMIHLCKSRGTTAGSFTVPNLNDLYGDISFRGSNGSAFVAAARISTQADNTPSATSMPGLLRFWTTPAGSTTPAARMDIRNDGNIGINQGGGATVKLGITADTSDNTANVIQAVSSASTELLRIRNDGLFSTGIGAVSPYNNTTATAANLVVQSTGQLQRSTSSLRYKTDVADYDKGMEAVNALRPVYYKGINDGDKQFAGFIAEEVDAAGLNEFVIYNDNGEPDALAYGNMLAVAVKAIQELNAKVEALETQLQAVTEV